MRTGSRFAAGAFLGLSLTLATGCDQGLKEENAQLQAEVEQMALASAERDSLLQIVVDNTQLMSEINAEISKVKGVKSGVVPVTNPESGLPDTVNAKTYLLERVKEVTERINESEDRLEKAQSRLALISKESDQFQNTVDRLQAIVDTQQVTMRNLTEQINQLQTENVRLVQESQALTDTVVLLSEARQNLVEEQNTAYYVIGTKEELKEMGVITEEGSKFLFFGGTSLHPSRNLTPDNFTQIDIRETTAIPLPEAGESYKIISRQNLADLTYPADEEGHVGGQINIANPEGFWAPSRYLIVVED